MKKNRKTNGVSLLEVMVAVAVIGLVAKGASVVFRNMTKSYAQDLASIPLEGRARDVISQISKDLEKASENSIGNLVLNGGFELGSTGFTPVTPIPFWDNNTVPPGRLASYYQAAASAMVRQGRGSVMLQYASVDGANSATFETRNAPESLIQLTSGRTYIVWAWMSVSPAGNQAVRGTISLMNGNSSVLTLQQPTTLPAGGPSWQLVTTTYKPTSSMSVRVRLGVVNRPPAASGMVFFDDIGVTAYSVLTSPYVFDRDYLVGIDPTQLHRGFRFLMNKQLLPTDPSPTLVLMRYRTSANRKLIRERLAGFNGGAWTITNQEIIGKDVSYLSFNTLGVDVDFDGRFYVYDERIVKDNYDRITGRNSENYSWTPLYDLNNDWVIDALDWEVVRKSRFVMNNQTKRETNPVNIKFECDTKVFNEIKKARNAKQVYPSNS